MSLEELEKKIAELEEAVREQTTHTTIIENAMVYLLVGKTGLFSVQEYTNALATAAEVMCKNIEDYQHHGLFSEEFLIESSKTLRYYADKQLFSEALDSKDKNGGLN